MSTDIGHPAAEDFRRIAIQSLLLVLLIWIITAGAALAALMQNDPAWAKVALCWQIWLVPGTAGHKLIEIRQKWKATPFNEWSNLYSLSPLLICGAIALAAAFFIF